MSFAKYHVNPKTGAASKCFAKIQCRFGGASVHFPSEADARAYYERAMERSHAGDKQITPGAVTAIDKEAYGITERSFTLPPGDYFVGDPYLFIATQDQEGWNNVVSSIEEQFGWEENAMTASDQTSVAVGAMYDNEPVLALKAFHGDGLHWSVGPVRRIPSESGLIGFISYDAVSRMGYTAQQVEEKKLGMLITSGSETKIWRDKQGIIVFGGKGLIVHNNLIADSFEAFAHIDGVNNSYPTKDTYTSLTDRAKLWRDSPKDFFKAMKR